MSELDYSKIPQDVKHSIYCRSVQMYDEGVPISFISHRIKSEFREHIEGFTVSQARDMVYLSCYHYVMKGAEKNESKTAENRAHELADVGIQ